MVTTNVLNSTKAIAIVSSASMAISGLTLYDVSLDVPMKIAVIAGSGALVWIATGWSKLRRP